MVWVQENLASLAVGLVLLTVLAAVAVSMARNRRAGKSGCGCGCEHCANRGFCHPPKKS